MRRVDLAVPGVFVLPAFYQRKPPGRSFPVQTLLNPARGHRQKVGGVFACLSHGRASGSMQPHHPLRGKEVASFPLEGTRADHSIPVRKEAES